MIFITRIPTHDNEGTPIAKDVIDKFASEVFEIFGGCTREGPGTGVWRDDQGRVYSEESFRLEVSCEANQYTEARNLVIRIGQRLGQKAMYFEVRYFDGVEILDIPPLISEGPGPPKTRGKKRKW